jgi:hypothetical protein
VKDAPFWKMRRTSGSLQATLARNNKKKAEMPDLFTITDGVGWDEMGMREAALDVCVINPHGFWFSFTFSPWFLFFFPHSASQLIPSDFLTRYLEYHLLPFSPLILFSA